MIQSPQIKEPPTIVSGRPAALHIETKEAAEVTAYKETYRCKYCGKTWDKTSIEDLEVPKEYARDEEDEEKGYDASLKYELAKEEE